MTLYLLLILKEVNEDSLKYLNAFLESQQSEKAYAAKKNKRLTFYVRNIDSDFKRGSNKLFLS